MKLQTTISVGAAIALFSIVKGCGSVPPGQFEKTIDCIDGCTSAHKAKAGPQGDRGGKDGESLLVVTLPSETCGESGGVSVVYYTSASMSYAGGYDVCNGADGSDGIDGTDGLAGEKGSQGEKGDAGASGVDGENGIDGIDGIAGQDGQDGQNGTDGIDGQDGQDGLNSISEIENAFPFIPKGLVDLCGNADSFGEVLVRLTNGQLLAHYSHGSKQFLTVVGPGSYQTADDYACRFTVDGDLVVEDEDGTIFLP